jgi:hypothetical protein
VLGIRLDIDPVDFALRPPAASLPVDLPTGPTRKAIEAVVYRGIMQADERRQFRPHEPITRAELASAIAATIHLEPKRKDPPVIRDVPNSSPDAEVIARVVGAGILPVDQSGAFRPAVAVTRQEAASALLATAKKCVADGTGLLRTSRSELLRDRVSREETAEALYKIIGFPW